MTSRRGRLLVVTGALLVLVVVVGLAAVALAPTALIVVGVAVIGLVAGLASRLPARHRTRPSPQPRTADTPQPDRDMGNESSPAPRWTTQWKTTPPPSAVRFARDQVTRVLTEWDLGGEAGEPTLLVVTELLSNAMDHAQAPIMLTVSFADGSVRVEVQDSAAEPPQLQPHDPWARRGRGLQVVEALSTRWGWTEERVGKTVWAEVLIGWPTWSTGTAPGPP
jgi:anti-sigma regulatory factor (Ser/Thr protein kinase)